MDLFKELGKACLVGVAIYVVFLLIHLGGGNLLSFNKELAEDFAIHMLYSVTIYIFNMLVFRYFFAKYKNALFTSNHLIKAILASVGITVVGIFCIELFLQTVIFGKQVIDFLNGQSFSEYWIPVIIALVVNAIFYFFFYYKYKKDKQVKDQKIIAGTASAQFDALKNQLDPHFLFNSLNVLTSLIEESPDKAQKFTTSLSKVYRYVLEQKNKELVSVSEELAFAKTYVTLLKMRYEESIVFTMPDPVSHPEAKIVPLALQLLLENAVKHNIVSDTHKLFISIEEEPGYLVVKNNLQPKKVLTRGSGVGLINIKRRYALLTSRTLKIQKTETQFDIRIPTLTRQLKSPVMNTKNYLSEKKYAMAKEHVEKVKAFYVHLTVYCIVMTALILFNLFTTSFPWVLFPALGWGLGVFFHAADTFNWNPFLGKNWEERKIEELMKQKNDR